MVCLPVVCTHSYISVQGGLEHSITVLLQSDAIPYVDCAHQEQFEPRGLGLVEVEEASYFWCITC